MEMEKNCFQSINKPFQLLVPSVWQRSLSYKFNYLITQVRNKFLFFPTQLQASESKYRDFVTVLCVGNDAVFNS